MIVTSKGRNRAGSLPASDSSRTKKGRRDMKVGKGGFLKKSSMKKIPRQQMQSKHAKGGVAPKFGSRNRRNTGLRKGKKKTS